MTETHSSYPKEPLKNYSIHCQVPIPSRRPPTRRPKSITLPFMENLDTDVYGADSAAISYPAVLFVRTNPQVYLLTILRSVFRARLQIVQRRLQPAEEYRAENHERFERD